MEPENQIMLLREAEIEPTDEVLKKALGKEVFEVYGDLLKDISNEFGLEHEWKFYKDGKAWLFKATCKKKTIFWLSIWEKFVKTSFYFTEKTRSGIFDLPISGEMKESFDKTEPVGKLTPLIFDMNQKEQLKDFREIVKYKKSIT